jgi:hypothetical protein
MDRATKRRIERASVLLLDIAHGLAALDVLRDEDEVQAELVAQLDHLRTVEVGLKSLIA